MLRGYLCMTHSLILPNMVSHVLFEGQDGHLTILTDCPYPSFWPELSNCLDLNSVMDGLTIEIYLKLIGKGGEKMLDWSLKQ